MKKPDGFCDEDYGDKNNKRRYAESYFRNMFIDIYEQLKDSGFKVRDIKR
jgi:hypothetical protein